VRRFIGPRVKGGGLLGVRLRTRAAEAGRPSLSNETRPAWR
jgi:hypothetical protein